MPYRFDRMNERAQCIDLRTGKWMPYTPTLARTNSCCWDNKPLTGEAHDLYYVNDLEYSDDWDYDNPTAYVPKKDERFAPMLGGPKIINGMLRSYGRTEKENNQLNFELDRIIDTKDREWNNPFRFRCFPLGLLPDLMRLAVTNHPALTDNFLKRLYEATTMYRNLFMYDGDITTTKEMEEYRFVQNILRYRARGLQYGYDDYIRKAYGEKSVCPYDLLNEDEKRPKPINADAVEFVVHQLESFILLSLLDEISCKVRNSAIELNYFLKNFRVNVPEYNEHQDYIFPTTEEATASLMTVDHYCLEFHKAVENLTNDLQNVSAPMDFMDPKNDEAALSLVEKTVSHTRALRTGIQAVNNALNGGFECGRYYMFVGPTGGGKSTTLKNMLREIVRNNDDFTPTIPGYKPVVLFISLENTDTEDLISRFETAGGDKRVLKGISSLEIRDKIRDALTKDNQGYDPNKIGVEFVNPNANVINKATINANYINALIEKKKNCESKEIVCVIIDYIAHMSPNTPGRTKDTWQELSMISEEIKSVAVRQNVVMITAAQVNRAGIELANTLGSKEIKKGLAQLGNNNIAGSVNMTHFCDVVIQIAPVEFKNETCGYLNEKFMIWKITKNRGGQSGMTFCIPFSKHYVADNDTNVHIETLPLQFAEDINTFNTCLTLDQLTELMDNQNSYLYKGVVTTADKIKQNEAKRNDNKKSFDKTAKTIGNLTKKKEEQKPLPEVDSDGNFRFNDTKPETKPKVLKTIIQFIHKKEEPVTEETNKNNTVAVEDNKEAKKLTIIDDYEVWKETHKEERPLMIRRPITMIEKPHYNSPVRMIKDMCPIDPYFLRKNAKLKKRVRKNNIKKESEEAKGISNNSIVKKGLQQVIRFVSKVKGDAIEGIKNINNTTNNSVIV